MTTQEMNQPVIADQQAMLDTGLEAVERVMFRTVGSEVEVLRDASRHILNAGGKRVRPRLAVLAYLAAGGTDVEEIAPPAAAVELMHTASVVHDDINDHGVMRRGKPSVNARFGRTFALLTGDFLFTAVYQLMAPYGELNIHLANAATALVEGETLQAYAVKNNEFTSENYARIIALKTAALFEAAGVMGARLADADEDVVEGLRQYSYNLGLAFQIVDDILDIVGDEQTLGKTAGIDLAQGRGIAAVQDESRTNAENNGDPMETIKRKLMSGGRLEKARQQAQQLVQAAIDELDILPDSFAKAELMRMAEMILNRNH